MKSFHVYILTNSAGVLYIGVTGNLENRFWQHAYDRKDSFVTKYNLDRLIYFERFDSPTEAIAREKQLKGWRRSKKIALIQSINPAWRDLSGRVMGEYKIITD